MKLFLKVVDCPACKGSHSVHVRARPGADYPLEGACPKRGLTLLLGLGVPAVLARDSSGRPLKAG